jgi:high frequency lysogenization protein
MTNNTPTINARRSQTIALSAMCQSALMIQQVSKGIILDKDSLMCLFNGLVSTEPKSVLDVYGCVEELTGGAKLVQYQLSGNATKKDIEVTRYLAGIMSISKKLLQNPAALSALKSKLDEVQRRLEHFELDDPSIIQNFAECYSEILSPLGQKIQVIGKPAILQQVSIQHKVRALLFSGVRAAVLWRQMGGKRRDFIFSRKTILKDVISFNQELTSIN